MTFSVPGWSSYWFVQCQRRMYCSNAAIVRRPLMSTVRTLSTRACATVQLFTVLGRISLHRSGAIRNGDLAPFQRSAQKRARWPSPTRTSKDCWNMADTTESFLNARSRSFQGQLACVRCSHNHCSLSAYAAVFISCMPRPPNSSGRHTAGYDTKHCPPVALDLPAHRKLRRYLSTSLMNHFVIFKDIIR